MRKIFLPKTVALLLRERKETIETYKNYLGDEYQDYTPAKDLSAEKELLLRTYGVEIRKSDDVHDYVEYYRSE